MMIYSPQYFVIPKIRNKNYHTPVPNSQSRFPSETLSHSSLLKMLTWREQCRQTFYCVSGHTPSIQSVQSESVVETGGRRENNRETFSVKCSI